VEYEEREMSDKNCIVCGGAVPEHRAWCPCNTGSTMYATYTERRVSRDEFALAAMQGMLAASGHSDAISMDAPERARYAYYQADAMIAERDKKAGG